MKTRFRVFALKLVDIKRLRKSNHSTKKQKQNSKTRTLHNAPLGAHITQENPFSQTDLNRTHFIVHPTELWASTHSLSLIRQYVLFLTRPTSICIVHIMLTYCFSQGHGFSKSAKPSSSRRHRRHTIPQTAIQHWIGCVLETRTGDENHVYLRVC